MTNQTPPENPVPQAQPQYGQFAPPGYQPPVQPAPYGQQQNPQQQNPQYQNPQYQYQYPAGPYDPNNLVAPQRKRQTWDVALTLSLLGVGLIGMVIGVYGGATFEQSVKLNIQMQGMDDVWNAPPWLGVAGVVIVVSHLLLYAAAVAVSIPLLLRKRIAFWAPLGAGIVAAFIFHGAAFLAGATGVDPTTLS